MQIAANINRFLTDCSSEAGFTDSKNAVSHRSSIQHLVVSHLAQTAYSQDVFLKLTHALIRFAEQAFILRDLNALQEASQVLMSLPVDAARQVGLYYHALVIKRTGQISEAQKLFETVANNAPAQYTARAIQGLGSAYYDSGRLDEALRFQLEALRATSDKNLQGLQTGLMARLQISVIASVNGDHKGSLSSLEKLSSLVNLIAKQQPFYFHAYCNELAIELGELGRITEAKAACKVALKYPFASAYPEWAETQNELEAKRTSATPSVVAVARAPQADPATQAQPQPEPKPLKLIVLASPAVIQNSFQISVFPIPATATFASSVVSILDRVLICAGPRAPPTF